MPWMETGAMEQKVEFILAWKKSELSMAALCRSFGISRQTGYKWVGRFYEDGDEGDFRALEERPRRPQTNPRQVDRVIEDLVIRARKLHPTWGPRKLRAWLLERFKDHRPPLVLPVPSTIGEILKRHGLAKKRQRRRHTPPRTQPFSAVTAPNAVWCVDFKGHFRTKDGTTCYPLTIMDAFSRYLIRCEGVRDPDERSVTPIFESAFRELEMPEAIRSDNGPPFASTGAGGLTKLSVWWMRLGLAHERIDPGKPQQNGRHERMHLTLKQDTASPPAADFMAQQRAFDRFRKIYNEERPHEAIEMRPPATAYEPSARAFPEKLPERDFDWDDQQLHMIDKYGFTPWKRGRLFIGQALAHETVEFFPVRTKEKQWEVKYGPIVLGLFDESRKPLGLIRPGRRKRKS